MFRLSYNTWRRGLFRLYAYASFRRSQTIALRAVADTRFHSADEDYRWVVLRTKLPPWLFQIVNLTFICTSTLLLTLTRTLTLPPLTVHLSLLRAALIQNVLLLLIASPTLIAATHPTPLTLTDGILVLTALSLLAWEFTADNQQFAFHAWKQGTYDPRAHWPGARLAWTKDDAARGFCTRGLWSWSRHPNFFAEQSFWVRMCPPFSCSHHHPSFFV
jgi:steroid 5-alpha reductase family enzyme